MKHEFNGDTVDAFLAHCESRAMSPETVRAYTSDLQGMLYFIGEHTDPEVLKADITHWLNVGRQDWAPRTTKRKLSSAKEICKYLGEPELLDDYIAPTPERAQPHPLPGGVADLVSMLQSTPDVRKRALVALCGLCGLRVSEALVVTVADFDFQARTLHVRGGKGSKDRVVPVGSGAWDHLFPCIDSTPTNGQPLVPWSNRYARTILTRLGVEAGIGRRVSSHDLRSTLLTAVYAATKDLRATQEIAGHSSSRATEGYTRISMDTMRDGVNAIGV